jgi:rhomboid protease GluP
VESPRERARPCPRCGALNGPGFDRCIRCAAPLAPLAAGADALKGSVDAQKLWGTKILIGLTLLVFAGQLLAMGGHLERALFSGGSDQAMMRFGALRASPSGPPVEPFRLLSAVFVHFGVIHIAMNMMSLANLGRVAEPGVGTARFLMAYFICGAAGFSIDVAWGLFHGIFTAGASGAVFGVNGLILGWLIYGKDRRWRGYAVQAVFFAVVLRFLIPINVTAHLGGLLCGTLLGIYYAARPRPKSHLLANIGATVGLVLAVVSLLLAQRAAHWGDNDLRSLGARLDLPGLIDRSGHRPAPELALCIRSRTRCATRIDSSHEVAV